MHFHATLVSISRRGHEKPRLQEKPLNFLDLNTRARTIVRQAGTYLERRRASLSAGKKARDSSLQSLQCIRCVCVCARGCSFSDPPPQRSIIWIPAYMFLPSRVSLPRKSARANKYTARGAQADWSNRSQRERERERESRSKKYRRASSFLPSMREGERDRVASVFHRGTPRCAQFIYYKRVQGRKSRRRVYESAGGIDADSEKIYKRLAGWRRSDFVVPSWSDKICL